MHRLDHTSYAPNHPLGGSIHPLSRPFTASPAGCSHDMLALSSNPALTPSMPSAMTHVQPSASTLWSHALRP